MFLALLFSFIISTEANNTFFTVPSWMPTAIDSTRTPGSDDYIGLEYQIVTNNYFTSWVLDESQSLHVHEMIFGWYWYLGTTPQWTAQGQWTELDEILGDYRSYEEEQYWIYRGGSEPANIRDASATKIEYYISAFLNIWNAEEQKWDAAAQCDIIATFVRTNMFTVITNVFNRITPTYGANVTATMEAALEREYFFNAGNDTLWNVSTYGPRAYDSFWFRNIETGTPPEQDLPFYYENPFQVPYAKNRRERLGEWRTIASRRFVEYGNLKSLYECMSPRSSGSSIPFYSDIGNIYRPGWPEKTCLVVSSSLLMTQPYSALMVDIPTTSSSYLAAFFSLDWKHSCWSIEGLSVNGDKKNRTLTKINQLVPKSLAFGIDEQESRYDNAFYDSAAWNIGYNQVFGATLDIENNYTNTMVSRRIGVKELGMMNNLLASMDKSFLGTGLFSATSQVTKAYHHNLSGLSYVHNFVATKGAIGSYVSIEEAIYPDAMTEVETNYVNIATNVFYGSDSHFLTVSNAKEDDTASWSVRVPVTKVMDEGELDTLKGYFYLGENQEFFIIGETNGSFTVWYNNVTNDYTIDLAIDDMRQKTATFNHSQKNNYDYTREFAYSEHGKWDVISYPRTNAFDLSVVDNSKMHIPTTKYLDDNGTVSFSGKNDPITLSRNYNSIGAVLTNNSNTIRTALAGFYQSDRTYGIDNWQAKIPINNSHWDEVGGDESLYVPANTIIDEFEYQRTDTYRCVTPIYDDETGEETKPWEIYHVITNGTEVAVSEFALNGWGFVEGTARKGYSVIKPNGEKWNSRIRKCGIIETDWNFKSMKRED